jgi:hypothetical protein
LFDGEGLYAEALCYAVNQEYNEERLWTTSISVDQVYA